MMHKRSLLLVLISLALGTLSCGMEQPAPPQLTIHTCAAPALESTGDTPSRFKPSPIESDYAWDVPGEAWARLGRGDVGTFALSPDGERLIVGSSIGIESFSTDKLERQWYETLDASPSDLTFSPDGQYIAGQLGASDLTLWQVETGEIALRLVSSGTTCSIVSPVWAPESMQIAFGSGGNVFIWDVAANQITEVAYEPTGNVTSVTWSHDERYLAIGAEGAITTIVRLSDQQTTATLNPSDKETAEGHDASELPPFAADKMEVSELMFGQADQTLVVQVYKVELSASRTYTLIWDLETGKTIPIPSDTNPRITAYHTPIAVSYDQSKQALVVYNTADGSVRTSLTLESDYYVWDYTWAAEANTVAATISVSSWYGTAVEVWNLDEGQAARVIDGYGGYRDVTWQSNDTLLVEAPFNNILRWNLVTGTSELAGRLPPKTALQLSPDFSRYVVIDYCKSLTLVDISGAFVAQATEPPEPCSRPGSISGDASHAALTVDSRTITVVDFESGSRSVDINLSPATTSNTMALSSDGSLLAVAHEDWSVSLWNTSSGQRIAELPPHDEITELLFSADASLLAVLNIAQSTQFIVVWDVASGQRLQTLTGSSLYSFAFDPQSQRIAGVSYRYVVIWDIASAEIIRRFSADEGDNLSSPAWSPDGKLLATLDFDQGVIIWRLSD